MEQGKDLSHLKLLDESNAQKKDLQRQVSTLKRELKALKSIGGEQAEEWDDPKRALEDLRLLYDQN
jgi:predicted site-specific integrase-resolvase